MKIEIFLVALGAAALTLILTVLFQRFLNQKHLSEIKQRDEQIHLLEKQTHQKERNFLEERNRVELGYLEQIKEAKQAAFEEGRQRGTTEGESEHLAKIVTLQSSFSERLSLECDKAVIEARTRLRAEYELQSKLFSVQISPLVRVTENKKLFISECKTEVGYQYQLLINGIPAFQPHIVIEESTHKKEVDETRIKELKEVALQIAESAINAYLGSNGQFAKLATPIVQRTKG